MIKLIIVLVLHCAGKLVGTNEQCDFYQFDHPFYPGESCKEIYDSNTQTHNRSGYYWLINPLRHVYCDMEQRSECGNIGGWTRIASVNITRGDECPTGWNKSSHDGISFCRSPSDNGGCYRTLFSSKGISYQKVCGMARGYQKGSPDAFVSNDGVIITHGRNPRVHIWSYIAGHSDEDPEFGGFYNCPCAVVPGQNSSSNNYYCESGTNDRSSSSAYYLSDPLWDGFDCPTGNTCCDNPNLPWFYRELDMTTLDDVEVGICPDENISDEALLVDQLELYIQ
ncbi:uncharacterized protein [Dysidea avara]|uniref:uncharacterized protein isoform X1 n=2 Tax=Dysidea avara TaxID=196820 RepID=UPI0033216182